LKITYLHQYFATPQSAAGTRSYEFARRLIANGHSVRMITSPAHMPKQYQTLTQTTEIKIDGISVLIIPVAYSNAMSFSQRIMAFVRFAALASYHAMRQPSDVIYATSTPLTIAIPGIAAKLWRRIPMVFEVRDLWPELPIAVGALKNPVFRWAALALEWIAYHAAAHVVALSPGMAEGVIKRGIPASRVTVIPNSSDVDKFDVPPETGSPIREALGITPDQPLVVYTGTFGLINNVGWLVDLAAAMRTIAPDVRFLLVGSGAEWEKVGQKAHERGVLDQNLTVWEPVPKEEMPAIFSAATVATSLFQPLPPMWNNSANKFFDALAAGTPIAINYGGWQSDLLNETGAGIVLPEGDINAAARQLADFVRDAERLQGASAAARSLAYTRFNRDTLALQLENVLKQAVST